MSVTNFKTRNIIYVRLIKLYVEHYICMQRINLFCELLICDIFFFRKNTITVVIWHASFFYLFKYNNINELAYWFSVL